MTDMTFNGTWPYDAHYFLTEQGRLHYIDVGPKDGKPIVCLHGNPTWGYLYRDFIPIFIEQGYRVIIPDHLGFGLSDKMRHLNENKVERHAKRFSQFMEHLQLTDVTLVLHDWGGPIGMGWAVDYPEKVSRLVILDTILFALPQAKSFWPFVFFMKCPLLSNIMIQGFNVFLKGILFKIGIGKTTHLNQDAKDAYLHPFPSWASRAPILNFARQIPLSKHSPIMTFLTKIEQGLKHFDHKPVHIFWASQDPGFKQYFAPTKQQFPQAQITEFDNAGHFLQEDVGSTIAQHITNWLEK